jgi:hypothetical protein
METGCQWLMLVILATQETDQENRSLKPAQTNVRETLTCKKPSQKRAGGVAQGVGPEFKPLYQKKKKPKNLMKKKKQLPSDVLKLVVEISKIMTKITRSFFQEIGI